MYFFPILHNNELLYSGIARYHEFSGNLSYYHTIIDVFGVNSALASVALPSRIKNIAENLAVNDELFAKEIVEKHTLLNFYSAFKTKEIYSQIEYEMIHTTGVGIHMKLGMVSSSTQLERSLKYCPVCVKNEVEIYGEPYWHREHQVFGSIVCHLHQAILQSSELPVFGRNRQIFYRITPELCKMEPQYFSCPRKSEILVKISKDINVLCKSKVNFSLKDFKNRLRVILYERGYVKPNNYTYMKKLTTDNREYYSDEVLELIGCSLEKRNWVNAIVHPQKNVGQPTQILLFLHFLGYTVNVFKEMENLENVNVSDFIQEQWDKELIILLAQDLSQRELCKELGATRKTILKAMQRMGLEKEWKYNGGSRYAGIDYTETEEYRVMEIKMKSTWLESHKQHPNVSSYQIRKLNESVYAWLKRYQAVWISENYRTLESTKIRLNWEVRDSNLLGKIEAIIHEFKSTIGTRVTWGTVGGALGIATWLVRKKDMLPLCTAIIQKNIESLEEYHLRVLRMAALELIAEGVVVRKYTILERAGVKIRFIPKVIDKLTEQDKLMGLDCLL